MFHFELHAPAFISKLYGILENPQFEPIIGWKNDKIFVIKDLEKLVNQVLPAFFNHSNLASFIR